MIAVQQPTDVPANAPDHCPGTESDLAGKVDACEGCPNQDVCASGQAKSTTQDPTTIPMINERLAGVKRKILVLSGKGGVGKSTFTSQLGWALAADEDIQVSFLFFYFDLMQRGPLTAELFSLPAITPPVKITASRLTQPAPQTTEKYFEKKNTKKIQLLTLG